MRDIKFRGKRVDNGEWVYGHFFETVEGIRRCYNIVENKDTRYYVKYDTVGQFTGLQNLYEGDKIKYDSFYTGDSLNNSGIGIIKFIEYGFAVYDENDEFITELFDLGYIGFEIIGNVHEDK